MAYRDRLADDMRGFWSEKGLRASHESELWEAKWRWWKREG
jgi:hypothetical protein